MSVVATHTRSMDGHSSTSLSETSVLHGRSSRSAFLETTVSKQELTIRTPVKKTLSSRETGSDPHTRMKRTSRLFDVLYDETPTKKHQGPLDFTSEQFQSPSYVEIEKAILAGQVLGMDDDSPHAPTVTMIDDSGLRRSVSVISNNASLRHRNTIKRRNKMMRRDFHRQGTVSSSSVFSMNSEEKRAKKPRSRRSRLFSIFPVRRRTSYKYYPASKGDSSLRFKSQKEVDDFYSINNITSLMKSLLPTTMNTFEFKKLLRLEPFLESSPAQFTISNEGHFSQVGSSGVSDLAQTPHLQKVKAAGKSPQLSFEPDPSQESDYDSDLSKRREFLQNVYIQYKRITFAGKRQLPLKIDIVLPSESEMMTAGERDLLNTRILFEVLLRRTLAAKIDFRVKQNKQKDVPVTNSFSNTSLPSSSSSSSSDAELSSKEGGNASERARNFMGMSHSGSHSPSLTNSDSRNEHYSEFWPSPQISMKSHTIGYQYPHTSPVQRERVKSATALNTSNVSKRRVANKNLNSLTRGQSLDQNGSFDPVANGNIKTRNQMLHHDEVKETSQVGALGNMMSLGNVDLSLLRPLNRSQETLSSTAFSGYDLHELVMTVQDQDHTVNNIWSVSTSSGSVSKKNSYSRSTIHTSLSREVPFSIAPEKHSETRNNLTSKVDNQGGIARLGSLEPLSDAHKFKMDGHEFGPSNGELHLHSHMI